MLDHLIIVDGYNLIHRTPQLRPGDGRTLRESRDKLINLLLWTMGGQSVRFLVVFDGDGGAGRENESSGNVEVRFSSPPDNADLLIRRIVEDQVEFVDRVTVVTADLEVARHARAMGADVSISDLFLAAALGAGKDIDPDAEPEKPPTLSKKEIEQWAELFKSRPRAPDDPE